VLTHFSLEGLPVVISLRGSQSCSKTLKEEREQWIVEEGAFFGNLFTSGPIRWFACKGKDGTPAGGELYKKGIFRSPYVKAMYEDTALAEISS
jgi:hypothetical protein